VRAKTKWRSTFAHFAVADDSAVNVVRPSNADRYRRRYRKHAMYGKHALMYGTAPFLPPFLPRFRIGSALEKHSTEVGLGHGPTSWFSDWAEAATSDASVTKSTPPLGHPFSVGQTAVASAWSGDLDLTQRVNEQLCRIATFPQSDWMTMMHGFGSWWTYRSDVLRRAFEKADRKYTGSGESEIAELCAEFPWEGAMLDAVLKYHKTVIVYNAIINDMYDASSCEVIVPSPDEASTICFGEDSERWFVPCCLWLMPMLAADTYST